MSNFNLFPAIALCMTLFSCAQKEVKTEAAPKPVNAAILVSCTGIGEVKLTDTYATLEKRYGAQALSVHDNNVAGQFVSLWENSPKQLNIFFKEKSAPFVHIRYIETFDSGAPYMTADSIAVGMTARDIVKRNSDMPISLANPYSQHDGGLIKGFNNGAVGTVTPCLSGHMEIAGTKNVDVNELADFKKEAVVKTSHRLMSERVDLVLANFRIGTP